MIASAMAAYPIPTSLFPVSNCPVCARNDSAPQESQLRKQRLILRILNLGSLASYTTYRESRQT